MTESLLRGMDFCAEVILKPSLALAFPLQNETSSTWSELTHTVGPLPSHFPPARRDSSHQELPTFQYPEQVQKPAILLAWLFYKAFGNKVSNNPDWPLTQCVAKDGLQLLILLP